ncbi:MAG TPA: hypothetical protein VFD00_08765 [Thermoclostridium sp.]|nr:hypothetical protein [Thermoclostridium sp.]
MQKIGNVKYLPIVFIVILITLALGTQDISAAPHEKNVMILHQYSEEYPYHKLFND